MRELLAVLLLLAAGSAVANPMLEKCLPFAPKECALTEASTADNFLTCFGEKKLFIETGKGQGACGEELAHARVHKACDANDIPIVCAGVKPGDNRTMSCLRKNKKKLGADCLKALKGYDALTAPAANGERKKGRGHSGVAATRC
jgi:hypothetical protein